MNQLVKEGKVISTKKVTSANEWEYTFNDLDKYDEQGKETGVIEKEFTITGVKDATKLLSHAQAKNLFDKLVNTDNMNANSFTGDAGSIKIVSYGNNGGTNISGLMKNFGAGNTEITNAGSKGINISGKSFNSNGKTLLDNKAGSVNISGNVVNAKDIISIKNSE